MPIDVEKIQTAQVEIAEIMRKYADALVAGKVESIVTIVVWQDGDLRGWSTCGFCPPDNTMAELKLRGMLHSTLFEFSTETLATRLRASDEGLPE